MPIIIPKDIPAYTTLKKENIFVMTEKRAISQDIRPIEIAIVNLMPTKIVTETQFLRVLSNTPLQVNITFINTETYKSKNTAEEYLKKFYKNFSKISNKKFDGMIVTGAPVENMDYEDVAYWEELKAIMDFAEKNVTSTLYICWASQAALYYHYGLQKHELDKKLFGIYPCHRTSQYDLLLKGLDDVFYVPQSRHSAVLDEDVLACKKLEVLARGDDCGWAIIKSSDNKKIFFSGHSEYDRDTLAKEYFRDKEKGLDIKKPYNYFVNDDVSKINTCWFSTANLLFTNWLNYYVYQVTPYYNE